jgi:CRISPR-associated endonuclease Csn1
MRILGIDLGIASCGWAVVQPEENSPSIIAVGARCFDAPLIDKTGEPKSAARRGARGQRKVIRRRRQRMNELRKLLAERGILREASKSAFADALKGISMIDGAAQMTPWSLRAAAHNRQLTRDELAVVLGHIARHRGFRSNSKREATANAADETSKMKKAMEATREGLAKYRSFGEMMADDPKFGLRKRNRDKDYSHTPKRSDLEDEVRSIFASQRRHGQKLATAELETEFARVAFSQRPLQDSEDKLGNCPFEPDQKRTAKRAPSFELFRYLSRLTNLRLTSGRTERSLTSDEIGRAAREFSGQQKSVTFKTLRQILDIDPNTRFSGIAADKEAHDVAARTGSAAAGTYALRKSLGETPWASLLRTPEKLDRIAEVLSFREDFGRIRDGLFEIGLEPLILDRLVEAVETGAFKDFSGAAHISARAARNIIPGLREGMVYSDACARVGYDHTARAAVSLDEINSPVARRAFGEAIKQVRAVARAFGPIDLVHIELARDVAKSSEERAKLTDGIEARNAEKKKRSEEAAETLARSVTADELLRYELAKEQTFKCVYCDAGVAPDGFAANDTRFQVDHILPWSRFGDDSYLNKTLCCAKCNQDKRGRTPFEWFSEDKPAGDWPLFVARFDSLKEMKGRKKRNFGLKDAASVEEKFKARNLTDTQWATRLLADELKRMFPAAEGERRIFARPGAITSKLRRAWGLESLKKKDGERVSDDRHHAIDAIVLAVTTESLLQSMTDDVKKREREGRADDIFHIAPPWPGFWLDAKRAVYGEGDAGGVFVSRAERPRARGKAHDATIRQIRENDGKETIYERKPIEKLSESDLDRIPVPEPYGRIADPAKLRDQMVEALRAWIAASKPKSEDRLPRSPKGDVIRKVRVATNIKVGMRLNGGAVDRGEMARVDVFGKRNAKGAYQYFLVPIYPHEIATMRSPPMRAVQGGGDDQKWPVIDSSFDFLWSIHQLSFLELTKQDGEIIRAYFRSLDRNTGAFTVSEIADSNATRKGIGARTLVSLKKFNIDRLGRASEVKRETRTWHGKACI